MSNCKLRHAVLAAAILAGSAGTAHAADWSDNAFSYEYGTHFAEPGITDPVAKSIVSFTHVDGYKYGSNFLNIDTLFSDSHDPANGSTKGATEVYAVYRHELSLSKISGKDLKSGPVRDWGISAGFDWNTKNTTFAPAKRMFVVGPTVNFDVPGFWDLSVMYRSESNTNGLPFAQQHDIRFKNTWYVETAWGIPFQLGSVPFKFKGFANYVPKKGKDTFGNETAGETLVHAALLADVGQLVAGKKDTVFAGVGYEYWNHKFGNASGPGINARTPFATVEWHL
jgi:nucleoside-specific outer membrane channel protein Tsx